MTEDTTIPRFSATQALAIASEHYGVVASAARPLVAYRDQNFLLKCEAPDREVVLKISNSSEDEQSLDLQNRALQHAASHLSSLAVARVLESVSGESIATLSSTDGNRHLVRILTFVRGRLLAEVANPATETLRGLGRSLAELDCALSTFEHPAAHHLASWDPKNGSLLWAYTRYLAGDDRRELVERHLGRFESRSAVRLGELRSSVIHNDGNPHNILVEACEEGECRISGIIDFGDVVHSHIVCEPAVAAAYAMLGASSPVAAAAAVVSGYHQCLPLTGDEIDLLFDLICVRLCASVTFSAFNQARDPDNAYLRVCEAPAWSALEMLAQIPPREIRQAFSQACHG